LARWVVGRAAESFGFRFHATEHAQEDRIVLFDRLIKDIDGEP
jgi:hypothetical protein